VSGPLRVDNGGSQPYIFAMFSEAGAIRCSPGPTALPGRIGVTRLTLTDFRNYAAARLTLEPGLVVVTGPNGAGKTNLLEAVSFLAPGRGLRGARLSEIDRRAAPSPVAAGRSWAVAAAITTGRGTVTIGTGRDPESGERRALRIDGEPTRNQAALGERLGVVWLTPQMDRLFIEGAAGRRRFLDRLVAAIDPAHASRVGRYEHALRERARLLHDGQADPGWLTALEEIMAAEGVAVSAARRDAVDRLDAACAALEGPFPRARLALAGAVEAWLEAKPALAAEAAFAAALAETRREDALTGGAAIGPHRSDLMVTLWPDGTAAEFASTGEQKALLISIVLAHARLQRAIRGEPPLLLLDEIAAHLDADRRQALFEMFGRLDGQIWLTGTDEAVFAPLRHDAQFLRVRAGTVS
jgi:DNA replication and repair protein RecF